MYCENEQFFFYFYSSYSFKSKFYGAPINDSTRSRKLKYQLYRIFNQFELPVFLPLMAYEIFSLRKHIKYFSLNWINMIIFFYWFFFLFSNRKNQCWHFIYLFLFGLFLLLFLSSILGMVFFSVLSTWYILQIIEVDNQCAYFLSLSPVSLFHFILIQPHVYVSWRQPLLKITIIDTEMRGYFFSSWYYWNYSRIIHKYNQ